MAQTKTDTQIIKRKYNHRAIIVLFFFAVIFIFLILTFCIIQINEAQSGVLTGILLVVPDNIKRNFSWLYLVIITSLETFLFWFVLTGSSSFVNNKTTIGLLFSSYNNLTKPHNIWAWDKQYALNYRLYLNFNCLQRFTWYSHYHSNSLASTDLWQKGILWQAHFFYFVW